MSSSFFVRMGANTVSRMDAETAVGDMTPLRSPPTPTRLMGNGKGFTVGFLGGTCGGLGDSCGCPEPPRRDADEALEVTGELALVREPGAVSRLGQGQIGPLRRWGGTARRNFRPPRQPPGESRAGKLKPDLEASYNWGCFPRTRPGQGVPWQGAGPADWPGGDRNHATKGAGSWRSARAA
jgi:hypothetical protein